MGEELADQCSSCAEVMPINECPQSQRPCGHHCNHSFDQDICHWCGEEFGGDSELVAAAGSATPTGDNDD
jgi:hypothetical protein